MRLPSLKRDRLLIRTLFFLIGVVALGIGTRELVKTIQLVRHAVHTTGHAVARSNDPAITEAGAHPDIVFTDSNGATVRFNQNGMGSRRVGTPLPVIYDPADPAGTAVVDAFWQLWYPVLLPFWFGLGFTPALFWGEVYSNLDRFRGR